MIDVHCHLQFHSFESDYDSVAKRAFDAGISRIINVGTKIDSSQKAVEFAEKYEQMYAIVGVHPHHADTVHPHLFEPEPQSRRPNLHPPLSSRRAPRYRSSAPSRGKESADTPSPLRGEGRGEGDNGWIEELEKLAQHQKVLAIGEIGMDYFSYKSNGIVDPKIQRAVFEQQIELAYKVGLPLQIHQRQAGNDVMEILQYHKESLQTIPGMFHCFAGDMDILKSALQMGFLIGFDGNVTYKGLAPGETTELKELARYMPMDRIVVETDAPFLTPIPHRGERNEPAYAIITGRFLAELKNVSFEDFVAQTTKNVYTVFSKLEPHPTLSSPNRRGKKL